MSSFIGSSNSDLVDFLDHFFLDDNALCCHPANNSKCTESVVEKVRVERQSPDEGKKNEDENKEKERAKSDELLMVHDEEDKARVRSERKRTREKQRRLDVNKQFSDLTILLEKINADTNFDDDCRTKPIVMSSSMSRNDLVSRTISVLNRIHSENRKKKRKVSEIKTELDELKKEVKNIDDSSMNKSGQAMMMMPIMLPSGPQGNFMPSFMPQNFSFPVKTASSCVDKVVSQPCEKVPLAPPSSFFGLGVEDLAHCA